jgi:DNA helicase-2/ATP-dependent DNA helicase PcrA
VVSEVARLVDGGEFNLGDFAVLYRTNAQSRALEEAFVRSGMPYKLVAGTRFYERREIKDVIAYLRLIQNPDDGVSLRRVINVPPRGIGQRSLSELSHRAKSLGFTEYKALKFLLEKDGEPASFQPRIARALAGFLKIMEEFRARGLELDFVGLLDLVLERSGYKQYILNGVSGEERWDNILELRTVAQEYRGLKPADGLAAFLEEVALVSDVDDLDESVNAVTLITLHQAKGLEFPVVFMVGMEDGLMPHFRSFDDPEQMEEERRLCYVGVTRAKQKVYLVRAFRRNLMGGSKVNIPSRFLSDIPPHLAAGDDLLAEGRGAEDAYLAEEAPLPDVELPVLRAGDHVIHAKFGEGVVVSCQSVSGDSEVAVVFDGAGLKRLLLSYARLEKRG